MQAQGPTIKLPDYAEWIYALPKPVRKRLGLGASKFCTQRAADFNMVYCAKKKRIIAKLDLVHTLKTYELRRQEGWYINPCMDDMARKIYQTETARYAYKYPWGR